MKGIISVVELVIVSIILLTTFEIFFPGGTATNRWQEADIILKSRDLLAAIDKTGDFYKKSFSGDDISAFIRSVLPGLNLFSWTESDGAIKSRIVVACDCTGAQISDLIKWTGNNKINGRTISFDFVPASLNSITKSDVLLIFGYKDLAPYKQNLKNYLEGGSGIVEIMDLDSSSKVDSVQQEIFGLKWVESLTGNLDSAKFSRKPLDSKDAIYLPYKYFYHLPLRLIGDFSSEQIQGCTSVPIYKGALNIRQASYAFWICSPNTVWFDTNANGDKDTLAGVGTEVTVGGYKFFLSYVDSNTIGLSFRPDYSFQDFLGMGGGRYFHIEPIDTPNNVVIYSESPGGSKFPAVIVNSAGGSVAWIADFSDSGVGDDEKVLLDSLLFRSSNKKTQTITGNIKVGYSSSYLNVNSTDMFEVYRFNLGLGFPF